VKRAKYNSNDFLFVDKSKCPKGYKVCGRDAKGFLCLNQELNCPINKIIFETQDSLLSTNMAEIERLGEKRAYKKSSDSSSINELEMININEFESNLSDSKHSKQLRSFLEKNKSKFKTQQGENYSIHFSNKFTSSTILVDFKLVPTLPKVKLDFNLSSSFSYSKNRKVLFHYLKGNQTPIKISKKKQKQINKIKEANHSHEVFNRKAYVEPCLQSLFPLFYVDNQINTKFDFLDTRYSILGFFKMSTIFKENKIFTQDIPNNFDILPNQNVVFVTRGYFGFDSKCYNHQGREVHHRSDGHIEIKDNYALDSVPSEIDVFSRKSDVLGFLKENEQIYDSLLMMLKYLCKSRVLF
jgi:hypothetical protein